MGDLPLDESCDGPVVVPLALKIDSQPGGLLPLRVPDIPLYALESIRDPQYAKRRTSESLSVAFKQVPEETDHDPGLVVRALPHLITQSRNLLSRTASPATVMLIRHILTSSAVISCLVARCSLIGMDSAAALALSSGAPAGQQRTVNLAHHDSHGIPSESVQSIPCPSCRTGRNPALHQQALVKKNANMVSPITYLITSNTARPRNAPTATLVASRESRRDVNQFQIRFITGPRKRLLGGTVRLDGQRGQSFSFTRRYSTTNLSTIFGISLRTVLWHSMCCLNSFDHSGLAVSSPLSGSRAIFR